MRRRTRTLVVLMILAVWAAPGVDAQERGGSCDAATTVRWVGGPDFSGDLILSLLSIIGAGPDRRVEVQRLDGGDPERDTIAARVTGDTLTFPLYRGTISLACRDDGLVGGWAAASGTGGFSAAWRPLARVTPEALDALAGSYRDAAGRRVIVAAVAGAFLRTYRHADTSFQHWYPAGDGAFAAGPSFERPGPPWMGRLTVTGDGLLWTDGANPEGMRLRRTRESAPTFTLDTQSGGAVVRADRRDVLRLRRIPAGRFVMGSPVPFDTLAARLRLPADQRPDSALLLRFAPAARPVTLARDFLLGTHEVTVAQFAAFVEATGHLTDAERMGWGLWWNGQRFVRTPGNHWRRPGYALAPDQPVTMVSWRDAAAFAAWLGTALGRVVRLPTEAEWEYAARAGGALFGALPDTVGLGAVAVYGRGEDRSQWHPDPVGTKQPNSFGVFDMLGNVWEWTADRYAVHPTGDEAAPGPGPRVVRGGSWLNNAPLLLPFFRPAEPPSLNEPHFGFRIVVEP